MYTTGPINYGPPQYIYSIRVAKCTSSASYDTMMGKHLGNLSRNCVWAELPMY